MVRAEIAFVTEDGKLGKEIGILGSLEAGNREHTTVLISLVM